MKWFETDLQYSLFCAFFILMLGAALGGVFGYGSPEITKAAEIQYSNSVVNQTYVGVKEQVKHDIIPIWVGIGLLLAVFIINNLAVATLIMFLPYYFKDWVGVLTTSYLLFSTGFIPGILFSRTINVLGSVKTLAAFVPHGIFEFSAIVIAGGCAYYYLGSGARDELKPYIKRLYMRYVVPLILISALIELFITPIFIYIV
jgi:uncharacterized membrane protein SpoIIM required for sporulation